MYNLVLPAPEAETAALRLAASGLPAGLLIPAALAARLTAAAGAVPAQAQQGVNTCHVHTVCCALGHWSESERLRNDTGRKWMTTGSDCLVWIGICISCLLRAVPGGLKTDTPVMPCSRRLHSSHGNCNNEIFCFLNFLFFFVFYSYLFFIFLEKNMGRLALLYAASAQHQHIVYVGCRL